MCLMGLIKKLFPISTNCNCLDVIYFIISSRLTTIDESASILSDISYDKTDDSLVCPFFPPERH